MAARTRNQRAGGESLARLGIQARRTGWRLERTRNMHLRWVSPDGEIVIGAGTSGYPRTRANFIAELKRAGLQV